MNTSNKKVIKVRTEMPTLSFRYNADKLFKHINKVKEKNIVLDFKEIPTISRSFAQQYLFCKKLSNKKITEINKNHAVEKMLIIAQEPKEKKRFDFSTWEVQTLKIS